MLSRIWEAIRVWFLGHSGGPYCSVCYSGPVSWDGERCLECYHAILGYSMHLDDIAQRRYNESERVEAGLGSSSACLSRPESTQEVEGASCVHPDRPLDQLCVDCPRKRCPECGGKGYFMPGQRDCPGCFGSGSSFGWCPGCSLPLHPTSGGKLQCRGCGYLVTCCE